MSQLEHSLRPWGEYQVLLDTPYTKVKEIIVNPGQKLSYQSHDRRQEWWVVVQGTLTVILDGKAFEIIKGSSIHIPINAKHRMINNTESDVKVVEVQTGSYFGEDDIIRYEDDYGR